MVAQTRRALREKPQLPNAAKRASPSTRIKTRNKTAATRLHNLERDDAHETHALLNVEDAFSSNVGTSSHGLPALHSTPMVHRKLRHTVSDLTKLSSPLPPSSPLATSPVNHTDAEERKHDAFGFFAAQNKLADQRAGIKKTSEDRKKYRVYDDSDIEDMYATDEERDAGGNLVPIAPIVERQPSQISHDGPRTSSKRSNKRKLVYSLTSTPESSAPRLPSSPSPTRPPMPKPLSAATIKGKGTRRRLKKKVATEIQQDEGQVMDPSMLMEHLESLLPKKVVKQPVRQANRRTMKKRKAEDVSDAGSEEQQMRKKGKTVPADDNRKKPAANKQKRRKGENLDMGLNEEQEVSLSYRWKGSALCCYRRHGENGSNTSNGWMNMNWPRRIFTSCDVLMMMRLLYILLYHLLLLRTDYYFLLYVRPQAVVIITGLKFR
jgi:hypothetical protein